MSSLAGRRPLLGPFLVLIAATGFACKAIFIKILYAQFPVDPETLLALSYTGIALVFASNLKLAQDPHAIMLGGGLVFLSALAYALYMIGSGRVIPRVGPARFTGYASTVACGFAISQFFLVHGIDTLAQPAKVVWLCVAMALISTVMPIWLMAEGIKRIGANQASMIGAIGPVLTIFFGWLILNEAITPVQIVGAGLVLAGVLLVSLKIEPAK